MIIKIEDQDILEDISKKFKDIGLGHGGNPYISGEIQVCELLKKINKNHLIIFDVGANKGEYSKMIIDNLDKKKTLHVFEPAKVTFNILKQNFKSNDSNIILNNYGIGEFEESKTLFYDKQGSGKASVYNRKLDHFNIYFNKNEIIKLNTIDNYCIENKINTIDLLKLDIEGHEYKALMGGEKMFSKNLILLVQFEFGGCNIDSRSFFQDFFYFFKKYNMTICRICPKNLVAVTNYNEIYEHFRTTNYLAVSNILFQ